MANGLRGKLVTQTFRDLDIDSSFQRKPERCPSKQCIQRLKVRRHFNSSDIPRRHRYSTCLGIGANWGNGPMHNNGDRRYQVDDQSLPENLNNQVNETLCHSTPSTTMTSCLGNHWLFFVYCQFLAYGLCSSGIWKIIFLTWFLRQISNVQFSGT